MIQMASRKGVDFIDQHHPLSVGTAEHGQIRVCTVSGRVAVPFSAGSALLS